MNFRSAKFWDAFRITDALRSATLVTIAFGFYSILPFVKENTIFHAFADHSSYIYTGLEVMLGLLLVLRTNAAYDRWWEGRKLWGKLVNISRNLVVKSQTLVDISDAEVALLKEHVKTFAIELKDHLRTATSPPDQFRGKKETPPIHMPRERVRKIYTLINAWRKQGLVSDDMLRVLDSETREFLEVCGACERIKKTPLSKSYRTFVRQCMYILLLPLPWSLVTEIGVWVIPVTMLHAYFFVGMEIIARMIEEPFGTHSDDLDLDEICQTIKNTI